MIRRRQKLIPGSFQLPFVAAFVGVAAIALLLQFLMLGFTLFQAASGLEGPGGDLAVQIPGVLLEVLAVTLFGLMPVVFLVGVALTHRVAGPLYRISCYLRDLADGKATQPCRIRDDDRLHGFCDLVNRATEPLRAENARRAERAEAEAEGEAGGDAEPAELRQAG